MARTPMTGSNPTDGPQYEDEIDLRRYVRFFTTHWLILLGGLLVGAVFAIVAASFVPLRYQSTATLMIIQPSGTTPLVLTPAAAKALLVDPAMVARALDELGLSREGIAAQRFIDESLDVEPVPATNLVRLSVVLSDPTKARLAAMLLASEVIDLSGRIGRDMPSASRKALEKQLAVADQNLKDVEQRLLKFKSTADFDISLLEGNNREIQTIRSGAATASRRTELYRAQLQLARLNAEHAARLRIYNGALLQYEDSNRPGAGAPQLQIVGAPLQPDQPMPRKRRQFASLGAVIGLVCGIIAALTIDSRRRIPLVAA
jgi:uncharacterized protein involved in exopolysaccharide biosynthesis